MYLHLTVWCNVQWCVSSLHSNQIASIVEEDLRLRDLEELYLSKNQITHVPERFMASMLALKVLDISHNQLGTYIYLSESGVPCGYDPVSVHTVYVHVSKYIVHVHEWVYVGGWCIVSVHVCTMCL